jgi:pimeloyl-ACP methyl ester carboxylesterase
MTTATHTLTLPGPGRVDVTVDDRGDGHPFLLLHGGGTPRPDGLDSMAGLAALYRELLDRLGLHDVTVVGNSIGGWIAAELALLGSARIGGIVLADAVGIEVEGHPVTDIFPLSPDELSRLAYHDPAAFRIDPAAMTEAQRAGMAANRAALRAYGGPLMADPALRARLSGITVPALVLWGDADQIADATYGRAYAAAIPGARFQFLHATGHLPQIETPDQLARAIVDFAGTGSSPRRE